MTTRPITLAETDALMGRFLQRQAQREATVLAEPTADQLAAHLRAAGASQGMLISDAEALACAQELVTLPVVRPAPAEPEEPTRAPDWRRPSSLAMLARWRQRQDCLIRWGKRLYYKSRTFTWMTILGLMGLNQLWTVPWLKSLMAHSANPPPSMAGTWFLAVICSLFAYVLLSAILFGVCELNDSLNAWFERLGKRWQWQAESRLSQLNEWSPSADTVDWIARHADLAALLRGLLDAPCPPLILDRNALEDRGRERNERDQRHAHRQAENQRIRQQLNKARA